MIAALIAVTALGVLWAGFYLAAAEIAARTCWEPDPGGAPCQCKTFGGGDYLAHLHAENIARSDAQQAATAQAIAAATPRPRPRRRGRR